MDLLLLHAAVTWALVGLIWNVQLVQYPGFGLVGRKELEALHAHHCRKIAWIVGPLMSIELVSAAALFWERPPGLSDAQLWAGCAPILVNAIWTGVVAVPLHARLDRRHPEVVHALVRSNWVRTLIWTGRGVWVAMALRATAAGS